MVVPSQVQQWLYEFLTPFSNKDKTYADVLTVLEYHHGALKPAPDPQHHRLVLGGSLPTRIGPTEYAIPIEVFLMPTYPYTAPLIVVRPNSRMVLTPHEGVVDHHGVCHIAWSPQTSTLIEALTDLKNAFSKFPPVHSRPVPQGSTPTPPRAGLSPGHGPGLGPSHGPSHGPSPSVPEKPMPLRSPASPISSRPQSRMSPWPGPGQNGYIQQIPHPQRAQPSQIPPQVQPAQVHVSSQSPQMQMPVPVHRPNPPQMYGQRPQFGESPHVPHQNGAPIHIAHPSGSTRPLPSTRTRSPPAPKAAPVPDIMSASTIATTGQKPNTDSKRLFEVAYGNVAHELGDVEARGDLKSLENTSKYLDSVEKAMSSEKQKLEAALITAKTNLETVQASTQKAKTLATDALTGVPSEPINAVSSADRAKLEAWADDRAIADTIQLLSRSLDREQIGFDAFVKHMRLLGREQFFARHRYLHPS